MEARSRAPYLGLSSEREVQICDLQLIFQRERGRRASTHQTPQYSISDAQGRVTVVPRVSGFNRRIAHGRT